jgi:PAS domain S-box-containing protein
MGEVPPLGGPGIGQEAPDILGKIRLSPLEARELFSTCPLPIWIFHAGTLQFLEANPAAEKMFGYSREEFLSLTVPQMLPREELDSFLEALREPPNGLSRIGVWRQRSREGKLMDVELIWASLMIEGQPCRLMLAAEMTERRWAEQLLLQVHAHTEHELGCRTMELDAAAQELESFVQALLKLAAQIPASAGTSGEDGVGPRIEKLCEELICLSRMTYRQVRAQEMNLSAMARDVSDEERRAEPLRKVRFQIQEGIRVQADPELIRMVLVNLFRNALMNARQSTPAEIEFGAREQEQEVVCYVRDNGSAFEPGVAEKLFLPFQNFDPKEPRDQIGLSLVRRIVAKHSGRVWAEGRPNQGTAIYFTLPPADKSIPSDETPA